MTRSAAAHHPPLDAVDVALRVLLHPALVAAVLGRVHGHEPRALEAPRQLARRARHQPVVGVDEVERERVAERGAGRAHVVVHGVDPGDEGVEVVLRELGLAHAVDGHAVAVLDRPRAARRRAPARAPRRRSRTSPSASLRTWRASPPSTIGGYSQDRMRTRIDTRGEDVTGPKLACLHHLESAVPGRRRRRRSRPPGSTTATVLGGDPLPDLDAIDGLIAFGGAQSVTEIDRYPYLLDEAELLREAVARGRAGARHLPRRPGARARARRQRPAAAAAGGDVARAGADRRRRARAGPGVGAALERGRDRAAARGDRAARARRPRLRGVPDRQRVGRAVPRRRRRRHARRLVRALRRLAGGRGHRRGRRPRGRRRAPARPGRRPRRRSSAASSDALEQREAVRRGELGHLRAP